MAEPGRTCRQMAENTVTTRSCPVDGQPIPARQLLLAIALVVTTLQSGTALAQPECPPVVELSGERALVEPVAAMLGERGISASNATSAAAGSPAESQPGEPATTQQPARPCGTLTAQLEGNGERVRITIVDADHRRVERVVNDPAGAVTAIESWTRRDVSAPLLAARSAPQPAPRQAPREVEVRAPGPVAPRRTRQVDLDAGPLAGVSSDLALWAGGRIHGCMHTGPYCVGVLIRYSRDLERSGDSSQLSTSRRTFDLMLTADRPVYRGDFELSPGIGIGQSSLQSEYQLAQDVDDSVNNLQLQARLAASYHLSDDWLLQADLALSATPLAETRFDEDEPTEPTLAGMPRLQTWLGIGVVYGGL